MDRPREVVFHSSANRPTQLMGGDREMVLCSIGIASLIAFSLFTFWGFVVAFCVWLLSVAVLQRMGKADPMMRQVYLCHIKYQAYYPAQSHRLSPTSFIPPNWS